MFKQTTKWILASSSPRRKNIFKNYGFDFEILVPKIDETPLENENPKVYALRVAKKKAEFIGLEYKKPYPVIAADTIIDLDKQIIGKPKDEFDSKRILTSLCAKKHQVHSAVYVYRQDARPFFFC